MARAVSKEYDDILLGTEVPRKQAEVLDPTVAADKPKIKTRKMNNKAYSDLMALCTDDVSFDIIDCAKSTDLPKGDAAAAWRGLMAKYEPSTASESVRLRKEFASSSLKSASEDPDVWLTALERKRQRMKSLGIVKNDDEMFAHVIGNLPREYNPTCQHLEYLILKKELTFEIMRDVLNSEYLRMKGNNGSKDKDEEQALVAGHNSHKKFKGTCRLCGVMGHKADQCWEDDKNAEKRPQGWVKGRRQTGGNSNNRNNNNNNRSNNGQRFQGNCTYCQKYGHREADCRKKIADERANTTSDVAETVLMALEDDVVLGISDKICKDEAIWIADTGATSHMTNNLEGMYDITDTTSGVRLGDGKVISSVKTGKLNGIFQQKDGTKMEVTLQNVKYVPNLSCNLFSVVAAMTQGCKLIGERKNNETIMSLTKGAFKIVFDQQIKTGSVDLLGIEFLRVVPDAAIAALAPGQDIKTTTFHHQLGHPSEAITRATARYMQIHVTGTLPPCQNCAMGKARQKPVPKTNANTSKIPGERLYIDISSIKAMSLGGAKFWLLAVDEATHMKWSIYLKTKDQTGTEMVKLIKELLT